MCGNYTASAQCLHAANKAYQALFRLGWIVASRSPEVLLPLYSANVRPVLEYCSQWWSPYLQKDLLVLEKVQKTFTKMVSGMNSLSYKARLNKLELFSLERRRKRVDQIKVCKTLSGSSSPELRNLFRVRTESALRGHSLALEKPRSHTSIRLQFFSNRVINAWNKLSSNAVEANSVATFKQLDESWPSLFSESV